MKIIDSHVHFFDLAHGDYHWLKPETPPFWPDKQVINKSFTEHDLVLLNPLTIGGFVHIEAGYNNQAPWQEISWLEQSCQLPFRSIANINLTLPSNEFQQQIKKLITYPSVVGCRHILDQHALALLTNKQVKNNFGVLNQQSLNFEVQMHFSDHQAVNALQAVIINNPRINFIINHAGLPIAQEYNDSIVALWRQGLAIVAQQQNVAIKCSGWEMLERNYNENICKEIIEYCLTLFGANRVMISSNFPLTLFSHSYQDYWNMIIRTNIKNLQCLLHDNSQHWYSFT
ncbi:amidohydrolase family protein [Thalassotalea piscium]|uniref:Putative TIM-barrel fold metal-dependent hydrolase n=1 Tax=Thalassotalea piscium TaxID=1230533 RepID=A0A7X0NED6_9GAMM|nr:amidohydrolase family protein [Thalassotalea piscium]MBB6541894.1 putative TIM-barrel fold metal-dependent hydrolase [Thalassotalea piscium]